MLHPIKLGLFCSEGACSNDRCVMIKVLVLFMGEPHEKNPEILVNLTETCVLCLLK